MFQSLGKLTTWAWPWLLGGWAVLLAALILAAPPWDAVAESGQFAFLPADAPSNRGKELFKTAFPDEPQGSNIVIVLGLEGKGLSRVDKTLIDEMLKPGIQKIAEEQQSPSVIARIRMPTEPGPGALLVSADKRAALVVIELTAEFLDRQVWPTVAAVENLIDQLRRDGKVPPGIEISLTGSAVVGRDAREAETESAATIQKWTVILVVVLLLVIYRAPVLALIPILTVIIAVKISLSILALMAQHGVMAISETARIYVTVLAYGAGVDYCLFLTARYREELERGKDERDALANAVGKVGGTVTASAATVIAGIAMLAFGRFGKYHQAGISIPLCLAILLCAALTFSPALLRLAGRWAFWPRRVARPESAKGEPPGLTRWLGRGFFRRIWEKIEQILLARPGTVWLTSMAVLLPFAAIAILNGNRWNYSLLGELPRDASCLAGTRRLQEHFVPGTTGPLTILIQDNAVDFRSTDGGNLIAALTARLVKQKDELKLADVRSLARPLGITAARPFGIPPPEALAGEPTSGAEAAEEIVYDRAVGYYVSGAGDLSGHVTRFDLVMDGDPLSGEAVDELTRVERDFRSDLPDQLRQARIEVIGSTASLRDLQDVTGGDLRRAEVMVPAVVFVILLILLRELAVSLYLILTVLFSYLTTLGVTIVLFRALDPGGFAGLDWKVPIFLFTILVAVGEDYNIFLMGRVKEEQDRHGPVRSATAALVATGGIISSCGIIMAGTFASLLAGTLVEMKQLGFALAFGVLLDTLIVRPLLVPSFVILLRKKWGAKSRAVPGPARLTEAAPTRA